MREVEVRAEWQSTHIIEIPDDHPLIDTYDLDTLLDVSGEDIQSNTAGLLNWTISDPGPEGEL